MAVTAATLALFGAAMSQTIIGTPDFSVSVHTAPENSMFPSEWRRAPISARATALAASERSRSMEFVRRAIEKYPPTVVRKNLRAVYLLHSLSFYGLPYGGTYSSDRIYIANRGEGQGFTAKFVEETFHHEFSSILLRNNRHLLETSAWKEINGRKVDYRHSGIKALREGTASIQYDSRFHQWGFLAEYATASMEEDFNMFAEGLFSGSSEFWSAVDRYPRLARKCELAIRFYSRLDPSLNEQFFRRQAA